MDSYKAGFQPFFVAGVARTEVRAYLKGNSKGNGSRRKRGSEIVPGAEAPFFICGRYCPD
ncbi:hypothetical protein GCM10011507_21920 [Edaphobacter acidisoli]|uniref:Uncharacterized protein n=1 Tax=Edaphobacter acidisoli TaxID=2040573 RepID=A0A916W5R8_9BACT|nr:hypothetical protein GCM10011507_21920 [Edaphobacter acidisoli]